MHFFRHRHRTHVAPLFLALLTAAAGCSSSADSAALPVPSPDAKVTGLCRNLDKVLPSRLDGLSRDDPEPRSALTAGWGGSAIILRCGVERPVKMVDPKVADGRDPDAVPGGVNGVDWLMERQGDRGYRFTTANRLAYVEVSVEKGRDPSGALIDLAGALKKAIPEGVAD